MRPRRHRMAVVDTSLIPKTSRGEQIRILASALVAEFAAGAAEIAQCQIDEAVDAATSLTWQEILSAISCVNRR